MIIHPISKESYLSSPLQHTCALVGAAFLVVCVSGGWLKYLSFTGAVTAGAIGAGLVSLAIESHQRRQVIEAKAALVKKKEEAKPPADPIDRFRVTPVKAEPVLCRNLRGLPDIRGEDVFYIADGEGGFPSSFLYINGEQIKKGLEVSLGDRAYALLEFEAVVLYSREHKEMLRIRNYSSTQFFTAVAYDETNQRLYVYKADSLAINQYNIIDGEANWAGMIKVTSQPSMEVDKAGNLYAFVHKRVEGGYHYSVLYNGKYYELPKEFRSDRMRAVDGKIYYSIKGEMFVLDLASEKPKPLPLPLPIKCAHILCFDVRGDLIVYVTDEYSNNGILFNSKTEAVVRLKDKMGDRAVQFCGEDTIASYGYDFDTKGERVDRFKFGTAVESAPKGRL